MTLHALLALVLTLTLLLQLRALAGLLRGDAAGAAPGGPRGRGLVWALLPVAAVTALAARSWLRALAIEPGALASVAPLDAWGEPPPMAPAPR
jgi:hypothetical protein